MIATLLAVAALQAPQGPYADSATAALVARARERHRQQDAAVQNYEAVVRTRVDANFARGRFARLIPLAAVEQTTQLTWQAPNDLRLLVLGERRRTAFVGANAQTRWGRPWFVPRFLGDSIRLLDNDFPERAAVHPLGVGAEPYYRYSIEDSLELALPGRTVRAVAVRVTPTRSDGAFVAGDIWLDAATAETVRFRFAFVGRRLWGQPRGETRRDSAAAERENDRAARVLRVSADLEYGLFQERFWLPYRQVLVMDIELPWVGNAAIPVTFISSFSDVRVNSAAPITFTVPLADSAVSDSVKEAGLSRKLTDWYQQSDASGLSAAERRRARRERIERRRQESREHQERERREGYGNAGRWSGGRFEVVVPSDSVLRGYAGWTDSLEWGASSADAIRVEDLRREALAAVDRLPRDLFPRPGLLVAIDRFADAWRFNRAEGNALGYGIRLPVAGSYVSLGARARYAFVDRRVQAALSLRRDAIGSRVDLTVFREMFDADPLSQGLDPVNSLRSTFLAHDDGSYVFAQGLEVQRQFTYRNAADVTLSLRFAQERAPNRLAHSGLNDLLGGSGDFAPLDPVLPGSFVTLGGNISGGNLPTSWRLGAELTSSSSSAAGRLWIAAGTSIRAPAHLNVALNGWVGVGAGDSIPQRAFRLGGGATLRGYEAGAFRGASAYAASAELSMAGRLVSPLVFADVGQAAPSGIAFAGGPRASVGAGVSVLWGLLRVYVARPLEAHRPWRFDIAVQRLR
jgi:hypothetical protein